MRLVDKDKLLEELIEGHEAGLGLIENSKYGNINNVDDAIDVVEYADEVDLSKRDKEIRADERAKVVKEIGNECSDKDLNENIDWCIDILSLFHVTVLDKKRLCEALESQKAMIVMHDDKIRADERQKFIEWLDTKYHIMSALPVSNEKQLLDIYQEEQK